MSTRNLFLLAVCLSLSQLAGCAAVAVTGIAAGTSAVVDRRTTGTMVEDEAIELKAIRALSDDKEINSQTHLNVTSFNTIVLVTGEAPTEALRNRAIQTVKNIPKVTQVHDEITIAAPSAFVSRSSDTLLTSKVKTRLLADEHVQGIHVKVVTENGVVYLMGLVSRAEGEQASELARTTGGVQKVVKLFQYRD